ncbi:MFS transporter [Enterococcus sp. DIV0660C]|uniref:MFS transporter n=1 Tax=Enterococcus sp. DIV0660C TaxID=2230880 RepID=UPI001A8DA4F7|nr:MFS transporter [Enterococcus sp. DIV0660C]MBO0431520.1 MFS transporter [Enterococcus sp. DIV0660C]
MKQNKIEKQSQTWWCNTVLFIISQGITLFGSSIVQMAIIWQVALETSSGLWVTLLTLASTIPQTMISFFAGVWADRYPRKRLIIIADAGIAMVTLLLALIFLLGGTSNVLMPLILVSVLRSLGAGIQTPVVSAVIPQIVPEEHLMRYNGINSSMMSIVQFAAPAVAGALLSLGSFHWILLFDVATAIIGIFILWFVSIPVQKNLRQEQKDSFFDDMKAGISYAGSDRLVREGLLTFGTFIFLSVPSSFLTVLMIERTFGESYMYLTVNEMVGFVGMALGGISLGIWGGIQDKRKVLSLGLLGFGLFSLAIGFTYTFWLFATFIFLMSFFIPMVQSAITTMLQENVPEERQGRVFGLLGVMYSGFMPLGTALFGPLADVLKIQWMVIACAGLILLLGLYILMKKL